MNRADLRRAWRMYLATRHHPVPYWKPPQPPPGWLACTWLRMFG